MKTCAFCASLCFQFNKFSIYQTKANAYKMKIRIEKKNGREKEKHFLKHKYWYPLKRYIGFPLTAYRRLKAVCHKTPENATQNSWNTLKCIAEVAGK